LETFFPDNLFWLGTEKLAPYGDWRSTPGVVFLFYLFWNKTSTMSVTWQMFFLSLNPQCPSTVHWPISWPYPFFIHHQTPDGRDTAPSMSTAEEDDFALGPWRRSSSLLK